MDVDPESGGWWMVDGGAMISNREVGKRSSSEAFGTRAKVA
jgi:hypothetical protein